MANRKRAEARRKAQAKAARRGQSVEGEGGGGGSAGVTINIWVIIVVVIAVVIGGIVLLTRGGDEEAASDGTTNGVDLGDLPTSQPVTITGDPLTSYGRVPVGGSVGDDPDYGKPAPLLSGLDFEGDPVVMDPATNGPYMVVFLAHWCPHCNAEVPRLLDWKASGAVPPELNVLGVATAVAKDAPNYPPAQWFSDRGWSWPVLVDESLGEGEAGKSAVAYGLDGYPYFVIVGADGLVKARMSGEVSIADLQVIVDEALSS